MNERASPVRRPDELPDWPRQPLRGHLLEGYRYTSRQFAAREWEQMWTRVWLLLGREDEMPKPGDWQQEEVGPESILMVRQRMAAAEQCKIRSSQRTPE